MNQSKWLGRALGAALLVGSMGACDFIDSTESDPNQVPEANVDQLFTTAQVNSFFFMEAQLSRLASMWTQQMAGTDRQFQALDQYTFSADVVDDEWTSVYAGGGLVDIRRAVETAEANGWRPYAGILKIHEAFFVGMAASIWGDVPYSEASDPDIENPAFDEQADVYASVLALLDEAIADLNAGGVGPAGGVDLNFNGDADAWLAVAHTLKARYYMHWHEAAQAGVAGATTVCGGTGNACAQRARDEALQGIMTTGDTWYTIHTTTATESNLWAQFLSERSGYISAGALGVNLLRDAGDPRLPIYYSTGTQAFAGQYVGSPPGTGPGDPGINASSLSDTGYGRADWDIPIVSCAENQFLLAEAEYYLGNTGAAQTALAAGVACEEARLGVTGIPFNASATGAALLQEIIEQKYLALFLNMEVWNDWKRTCEPDLISANGIDPSSMPRRVFYGQQEAETNENTPPDDRNQPNDNDPNAC